MGIAVPSQLRKASQQLNHGTHRWLHPHPCPHWWSMVPHWTLHRCPEHPVQPLVTAWNGAVVPRKTPAVEAAEADHFAAKWGKRSADSEADAYYGYGGYGGYGLGSYGAYNLGYGYGGYGKRSADSEADAYYGYGGYGGYGLGSYGAYNLGYG